MQLNAISKGLLIAIPALLLTACGATSDSSEGQAETTTNQQSVQTDTMNPDGSVAVSENNSVEVNSVEMAKTPEMLQEEKYEELRQDQTIYFDFDTSKVDTKFMELLQAHADYLVKNPSAKVMVEGHCDERGTPEYNIALGERRAKAVAQYLQNLGVMGSQITTVSYGEEKPVDMSRTEDGFSKNRRAVLVY
jgi:peptidoglycan-associated lipoprotein